MFYNTIILGDVIKVVKELPDSIIDCGVTSPPYNKQEKNKGWMVKNVKYDVASDNKPEAEYQVEQIEILNEIYRATVSGGSFFYNHKLRWDRGKMIHPMEWLLKTKWNIRQEIIWNRAIAANIRGWRFWQVEERIYWLQKPVDGNLIGEELESRHAKMSSIWSFPPERDNDHPAPFPIQLPTRCIYSILGDQTGKTILDPYMGSGTTGVAAKLLGHNYIGFDISQQYINQAEARIKNAYSETDTVEEEKRLHKVEKTYADRKREGKWDHMIKKKDELTLENFE